MIINYRLQIALVVYLKVMDFMQIKTKGLIGGYNQGYLALSMTEDAMKEFCDYHGIPYTEGKLHTNGIVTTRKWKIQSKMKEM